MQKGLTWFLTVLALALFACIYFVERKVPSSADRQTAARVFPTLTPGDITAIEITFGEGAGVLRAEQTNGTWFLTKPLYPAQQSLIETFATNIARMRRYDGIPPQKVALEGQKSFGLEPPRASVLVETPTNRIRFEIGGAAPLTNNIYVRVEPSAEVLLTQSDVLQSLPRTTNDWRSGKLLPLEQLTFDHVEVRAAQRGFGLGKNPTNNLWQITKPIPARADQNQVAALFEQLGKAQVGRFVADGAVDLEPYNLDAPQTSLVFSQGTNTVFTVQFSGSITNETEQVYARLLGNTNIVTAPRQLVDFLRQPYKAFHDPRLVTIDPNAVDRILVQSLEKFTLQRQPSGQWTIGENVPADWELLAEFLRTAVSMRILDIAKEVPTEADLNALGLQVPRISYSFFEKHTNTAGITTNILFTEISFGTNLTDRIYVRRSDETPVYITPLAPLLEFPHQSFRMKERTLWNLSTNEIVRITLRSPAGTNTATRINAGWSADAVVNAAIDEAAFRLSQLKVARWVAQGEESLKAAGITPESQELEVEIKKADSSEVLRIRFGKTALQHNIYGTVPGDQNRVIFEFPGEIYHLLTQNLPAAK